MTVQQLIEKLESFDTMQDAEVVIFNDGCYYEWYGTDELTDEKIIVKPNVIYILFGSKQNEEKFVDIHYRLYMEDRIELTDRLTVEQGNQAYENNNS